MSRTPSGVADSLRTYTGTATLSTLNKYAYGFNRHGDATLLLDGSTSVQQSYAYLPYGSPILAATKGFDTASANAMWNPIRYNAARTDPAGGVDFGPRSYDPSTHTFNAKDSFGDAYSDLGLSTDPLTANRFSYGAGNPVSYSEWDGHQPLLETTRATPYTRMTGTERAEDMQLRRKEEGLHDPSTMDVVIGVGAIAAGPALAAGVLATLPEDAGAAAVIGGGRWLAKRYLPGIAGAIANNARCFTQHCSAGDVANNAAIGYVGGAAVGPLTRAGGTNAVIRGIPGLVGRVVAGASAAAVTNVATQAISGQGVHPGEVVASAALGAATGPANEWVAETFKTPVTDILSEIVAAGTSNSFGSVIGCAADGCH